MMHQQRTGIMTPVWVTDDQLFKSLIIVQESSSGISEDIFMEESNNSVGGSTDQKICA